MGDTRAQRHSGGLAPTREEAEVEFNRIVAFSDGVFAIAITLLVLALEVPANATDLGQELRDRSDEFFAYAISFAVLGKLWISHHRFFGTLGRFNGTLLALNLLYLAFIALVPFTSDMLGNYSDDKVAVIAYALNLAAIGVVFSFSIRYSFHHGLIREFARADERRFTGWANFAVAGVFLASIPVALLSPGVATWSWLLIFVLGAGASAGRRSSKAG